MAEQTYDLTQMGAEVQAIINDANNVKGAGAQTTLTTEYVLLKDTDGQYHKILKSSFTEAIRDTFAGLLVNNDKGTTINQIAAIASGDFGSVTPVNLASVLGGSTSTMNNATDAQFDALYGTSSVHTFNGYSGTYFGDNTYGFVKTTMGLDGYCIQEVYNILTQSYWRRTKTSSAGSWGSFTRSDSVVYATNAREYILDEVVTVAIEGDFRWDKGAAIVEIYAHTNHPAYAKYVIGRNDTNLNPSINRIENQQIGGTVYPSHVYYSGTANNGRIVIAANNEKIHVRITCSTSISLSSNTDTTGMTEKTFS